MKKIETIDVVKGAVAGLVGGIVATVVMGGFQSLLSALAEEEKKSKKKKEEPATVKAAEEISEAVLDHKLTKSEKELAGEAMHYAMGATSGLIYGVAAEIAPISTVGAGLPFGAAVWLVADDIVVPALGLSKPITEFSLSTHAYALSSHLVYGLTTDLVRRTVRDLL
jgi:putative membrane protein